jgi:hypothetical protein
VERGHSLVTVVRDCLRTECEEYCELMERNGNTKNAV